MRSHKTYQLNRHRLKNNNDKTSEKQTVSEESKKSAASINRAKSAQKNVTDEEVKSESIVTTDSNIEAKPELQEIIPAAAKLASVQASRAAKKSSGEETVKGKILSAEDNSPIAGASVIVKGTNRRTLTDSGGNFDIKVPDTARKTIMVNYIGMESKEFTAKPDSSMRISLEPDVSSLSEVVVVGYGSNKQDEENKVATGGYTPPQPVNGKKAFNTYIEE